MASPEDQFHGEEGEEELPTLRVRASVNPDIKQQRMRLMARNPSDVAALAHNRRASLPARARVWTPNDDYKINSNHSPSSSPGNSSSARHRANSVGADKTSFESRRKKPARRSSLPPGLDPGIKPMDPGHSSASTYPKTESNGLFQATSLYHHPQSMDRVEDKSFETMRRGFVERWRQQPWRPRVVQVMDDMRSQCILFVALLIALYAADIAGIVSVSDDMMPMVDGLLLGIFVLFGSEFLLNCLARDDYPLGFFFWMDMIGTLSIVADISWMADSLGLGDADENTLKASRAARVGGRGGRLTRILKVVRLLKLVFRFVFNPNTYSTDTLASSGDAPSKIGQSLSEAISYQVTSLVLLTVLVIPMLAPFDESGMAPDAYANLLDSRYIDLTEQGPPAAEQDPHQWIQQSLEPLVVDFLNYFKDQANYQPVDLTITSEDGLHVYSWPTMDWRPMPKRSKNVFETAAGHALAVFDISEKNQEASMFNILFITYVLVALVTFSAILSAKSNSLVVRPLKRIFSVINEHASHVLGMLDVDFSKQEMERTVSRVRLMMANFNRGSKAAEDLLQGNDQLDAETKAWLMTTYMDSGPYVKRVTAEEEQAVQSKKDLRRSMRTFSPSNARDMQDFNSLLPMLKSPEHRQNVMQITLQDIRTWDFDAFRFSKHQLYMCVYLMFDSMGIIDDGLLPIDAFWHFIDRINDLYHDNPYHNFKHCIDVTQAVCQMLDATQEAMMWQVEEKFAMLVGAICHDLDHPGVNNAFLINTRDVRALRYNDASVLENVHVATLYQLVGESPETNVFQYLEEDLPAWTRVRKIIVSIIMHTDMIHHFNMVAKLELLNDVHARHLEASSTKENLDTTVGSRTSARDSLDEASPVHGTSGSHGSTTPSRAQNTPARERRSSRASIYRDERVLASVLSAEERSFLMNVIMHSADISNPAKPYAVYKKWARAVMDEFFAQGDMEKANGMPVSPMMDRDNTSIPVAQVNFIEFVVTPLYRHLYKLFPQLEPMMLHLVSNRVRMGEMCYHEEQVKSGTTPKDLNDKRKMHRTRFTKYIEQNGLKAVLDIISQTDKELSTDRNNAGMTRGGSPELESQVTPKRRWSTDMSPPPSNPAGSNLLGAPPMSAVPSSMSGTSHVGRHASVSTSSAYNSRFSLTLVGDDEVDDEFLDNQPVLRQATEPVTARSVSFHSVPRPAVASVKAPE